MVKSATAAIKLYSQGTVLARFWISKYYSGFPARYKGISIQRVQAFSAHYYFLSLINRYDDDERPQKNFAIAHLWGRYPIPSFDDKRARTIPAPISWTIDIVKSYLGPKRQIGQLKQANILIISGGRHFDDIAKLVISMAKKHDIFVAGKLDLKQQSLLKSHHIDYLSFDRALRFLPRTHRLGHLIKFLSSGRRTSKSFSHSESVYFNNKYWKIRLWYLRLIEFPEICSLIDLADTIFKQTQPKILLTTSSNDTYGAPFTLTAQKMKITDAELQHGFGSWDFDWVYSNCTYQILWGELQEKILKRYAKYSVITGNWFMEKPKKKHSVPVAHKNVRVLVLWSPPNGSYSIFAARPNNDTFVRLMTALGRLPANYCVTFRSHPSYKIESQVDLSVVPENVRLNNRGTLKQIVASHDIVVTAPTTAGFEAILQYKPLLFFDNSWLNQKYSHPYVKYRAAQEVPLKDLEKLNFYLVNLLANKSLILKQRSAQAKFIKNYSMCFGDRAISLVDNFVTSAIAKM